MARSKERLYRIWIGMKTRCCNPNSNNWKSYGGKGITICDEWINDYDAFRSWSMDHGYNDNLSIDRIDNSKGYCPSNCRWVTELDQRHNLTNNKWITYNGQTKLVSEWAREYGINVGVVLNRINNLGWPFEKAISEPIDRGESITYNGQTKTIVEWAEYLDIPYGTLQTRLHRYGWDTEQALTTDVGSFHRHNPIHDTKIEFDGVTKTLQEWSRELGVPAGTIKSRIDNGWPMHLALSSSNNGFKRPIKILIEYNGVSKPLTEWAKELGVKPQLLYDRIYVLGWDIERAFTLPASYGNSRRHPEFIEYNGESRTISEWADLYHINVDTLRSRCFKQGWSIEEALTRPVRKRGY